ncbi:unnamed protein product [Ophioblennius macclurei]
MNRSVRMVLMLLLLAYSSDAKMNIIPTKQDAHVGEEILLLCKAGGEGDITWQKDGEEVDDEEKVVTVDETTSQLIIKNVAMQDAGRYTCLCEYASGHRDDVHIMLYVYEGPSFGTTTTYHEFLEGTDALVPCLVTGQPAVDVQWIRNKEEISSNAMAKHFHQLPDNSLRIEQVRREDAGTYICNAKIRGRPVLKPLSISVVVNAPPTVHLKEEVKKVFAGPETNVSLLCLVDGHPKPNINWTLPVTFNSFRHHFNSDRSQLTIQSVARADFGEYICTATNKIAESSATIMLHVFEAPEVFVSVEQLHSSAGDQVTVSCNVSGHPQPQLYWLNKQNGRTLTSSSGRVRVEDGVLFIDDLLPSDGGLYSCMAVSTIGNASRDVAIFTEPGSLHYMTISPSLKSVVFMLKSPPINGGTPITSYVLQWRENPSEQWKEVTEPASDVLTIKDLLPYTTYSVRMAAVNAVGLGQFSDEHSVRTKGIREPDSPVLKSDRMKMESNSFSVPFKHNDDGGTPLQHFNIRYKQDEEGSEWKETQLESDADSISLEDLAFGSNYQLEVTAVNANGSSLPATFNFTVAEQPVKRMTKGSVVGIVMVIFLLVLLVVDATCCYTNRCGLLMSIAVKLFGRKVPGMKNVEEGGEGNNKGELNLKGVSTMGENTQGTLTKEAGRITEVTCDKAPLTKHEKTQPDRDLPPAEA